jgi:hypothetical protein
LTDEQIAIFRFSEIQEMIKRHTREMEDKDDDDERKATAEDKAKKEDRKNDAPSTDPLSSSTPARPTSSNKRALSSSNGRPHSNVSKKRKHGSSLSQNIRLDPDGFKDEGASQTYRRICREMDEQKSESVELDY